MCPDIDKAALGSLALSQDAKAALALTDRMIDGLASLNKQMSHLQLYSRHWRAIERSVSKASEGRISLGTHTYRGYHLIESRG